MNPHDMYYHLMTLPKNGPQKNGTVHAHHLLERMLTVFGIDSQKAKDQIFLYFTALQLAEPICNRFQFQTLRRAS